MQALIDRYQRHPHVPGARAQAPGAGTRKGLPPGQGTPVPGSSPAGDAPAYLVRPPSRPQQPEAESSSESPAPASEPVFTVTLRPTVAKPPTDASPASPVSTAAAATAAVPATTALPPMVQAPATVAPPQTTRAAAPAAVPRIVAPDPSLRPGEQAASALLPAGASYYRGDDPMPVAEAAAAGVVVTRRNVASTDWFATPGVAYSSVASEQTQLSPSERPVIHVREDQRVRFKTGATLLTRNGGSAGAPRAFVPNARAETETTHTLKDGAKVLFPDGGARTNEGAKRITVEEETAEHVVFRLKGRPEVLRTAPASAERVAMYAFKWPTGADDFLFARDDVEVVQAVIFRAGSEEYIAHPGDIISKTHQYDWFTYGADSTEFRALAGVLTEGSPGHTAVGTDVLFGPEQPSGGDVEQLGLGDCYLKVAMIELAERDPAHLQAMMRLDGTRVTVRFHHQTADGAWAPEDIVVAASVATDITGKALYEGGETWARLLQKAFTVFAHRHGKYGEAFEVRSGNAGYGEIEGGEAHGLYNVFYGASAGGRLDTIAYAPADADLGISLSLANDLASFVGPDQGTQTFLTAGASFHGHVNHALAQVAQVVKLKFPGADVQPALADFETKLTAANIKLGAEDDAGKQANANPASVPEVIAVKTAAEALIPCSMGTTTSACRD